MYADAETAGSMFRPPQDTSQSKFSDFPAEFIRWGYNMYDDTNTNLHMYYYGLGDALKDIGASQSVEDWKFWKVTHGDVRPGADLNSQTYLLEGRQYRVSEAGKIRSTWWTTITETIQATGAYYVMPINIKSKVLIIAKQYSAYYEATHRIPPLPTSNLPSLKYTSDIAYGVWTMTPGTAPISTATPPIQHIFTWAIRNEQTTRTITRALHTLGKEQKDVHFWPGIEIPVDSEAGEALLGTPCGAAVGFLLATRKKEWGGLRVVCIRVFEQESYAFMERVPVSLYWGVGEARVEGEIEGGNGEGV